MIGYAIQNARQASAAHALFAGSRNEHAGICEYPQHGAAGGNGVDLAAGSQLDLERLVGSGIDRGGSAEVFKVDLVL